MNKEQIALVRLLSRSVLDMLYLIWDIREYSDNWRYIGKIEQSKRPVIDNLSMLIKLYPDLEEEETNIFTL